MSGRLLVVEMRRALHRRVVWVLVGMALLGVAVMGVVAFVDAAGKTIAEMRAGGSHPSVLRDWWVAGSGDGILMAAVVPLVVGGFLGGASVVGAEWRAGTVTTVLTWEPRRLRLHAARVAACFLLATAIAAVLQALFLAATVPAVLTHGTTAGVDGGWWLGLVVAVVRVALLTGATAVLGASLATIGRSGTFALAAGFGWMAVGEGIVRSVKPSLQRLLVGENLAVVLPWAELEGASFTRSEPVALATIACYFAVVAIAAAATFARRDIADTS